MFAVWRTVRYMTSSAKQQLDPEQQRLQALQGYQVLDTDAELAFDELTRLTSVYFDVPIALVSLLDDKRQWFKSRVGIEAESTPRSIAFCDLAIRQPDVTVIPDALKDPRFAHNPLVTGEPGIRFYAGAPLITPDGHALGTLCIIDRKPREFTPAQRDALAVLSRQVVAQLELRKHNMQLTQAMGKLRTEHDLLQETRLQLENNGSRMELVLKGANDGWWDWDLVTGQRYYSLRGWSMLGYENEELPYDGQLWEKLIHPDDVPHVNAIFGASVRGSDTTHYAAEFRLRHKDGHFVPVLSRAYILRNASGKAVRLSGTNTDLSEFKRIEQARRESQESYELLFTNSMDGVLQTEPGGAILSANPAACDMLGMSEAELKREARFNLLDTTDPRLASLLDERTRKGRARGELRMTRPNGELFEVEVTSALYKDKEGRTLASVVFRDISERKAAEANTYRLAYFDALTGLPNRRLFQDRMVHALAAAQRAGHVGALIFIDLDNFKHVNDARGHSVGDTLLIQVARRLSNLLRAEDTVARLGGDEFVVLIDDLGADEEASARLAMAVADKVREVLDSAYEIEGHTYSSTGSIGITLFPKNDEGVEDLLREADTAMYRAKAGGRNRISFFETAMQTEVEERLAMEQDLKDALATGQLEAHVQPQVDGTGRMVGGELLLRWHHPVRGSVPPVQFIPVAEESGLIQPVGDWVLLQACDALARMQRASQVLPLSVNVSPRQFRSEDFVERVCAILAQTGALASGLIFEVTEGLLIEHWEATTTRMSQLVALGIRFSIDDFGTGYSSLSYLKKLPLYELKIDRSFVQDTPEDSNDTAIVQSILSMARHLKLRVVAEGVETREQADFLINSQCDCLQGYLFGRPRPLKGWLDELLGPG